MKAANRSDFKTKPFPAKHATISLDRVFSNSEMDRIGNGCVPQQMEDKWFIYWDKDELYFHRSWVGFCIYIVRFEPIETGHRMVSARLNRNPKQYGETSDHHDQTLISYLIDVILLQRDAPFPTTHENHENSVLANWSLVGSSMFSNALPGDGINVSCQTETATIDGANNQLNTYNDSSVELFKLVDLIRLSGVRLRDYKIHCATGINSSPLEAFLDGTWKEWQERQNKKNFECRQILSLIQLGGDRWLFAGAFDVLGVKAGNIHNVNGFEYQTSEVLGLEKLVGRAEIRWKKTFRASYIRGKKYEDNLRVLKLRENRMTVGDFPGFNRVLLSHTKLRTIVRESNPSWRAALMSVAGVYLITDNSTGKHYVGSAYGGIGLWQRWCQYAKNGHGNTKELKVLLDKLGESHMTHLQFAIVEISDINASDEFIISRETHWKKVIRSREFGLNKN